MLYGKGEQRTIIERTVRHAAQVFDTLKPYFGSVERADLKAKLSSFLSEVGISLIKSTLHFKNEAFESEDEWRVFKLETRESLSGKLRFRARPNGILPYIEFPFEPQLRGLGPLQLTTQSGAWRKASVAISPSENRVCRSSWMWRQRVTPELAAS
jgi:hypothetical protein